MTGDDFRKAMLEDYRRRRAAEEAAKAAVLRGDIQLNHLGAPGGLRTVEDWVRQQDGFIATWDKAIAVLKAAPRVF